MLNQANQQASIAPAPTSDVHAQLQRLHRAVENVQSAGHALVSGVEPVLKPERPHERSDGSIAPAERAPETSVAMEINQAAVYLEAMAASLYAATARLGV